MKNPALIAALMSLWFGGMSCGEPRSGAESSSEPRSEAAPSTPKPDAKKPTKPELTAAPSPTRPAEPAGGVYPLRWTDQLGISSLSDLPHQLAAPSAIFGELAKGEATVMPKSCNDWARLHAEGYEPSSTLEVQPDVAAKSTCEAIRLLQSAKPASRSFVRELKLTPKVVSILPAAVASSFSPEDEAKVAVSNAQNRSLKDHDPKLKAKAGVLPGSLEITAGDGQSYTLIEPLAWGDFDGDGLDDLLIAVSNGATEGSLLNSRVIALSRADEKAMLRVVKVAP